MAYCPVLFYLDEWFIERKGLAYGIFWAGGSLCGAVIPFVMGCALNAYGFQITLRAWAVFLVREYQSSLVASSPLDLS